jgi:hypothetical protein
MIGNRRLRWISAIVITIISILAFDFPIGYGYYQYSCFTNAGQHIYRKVSADGFIENEATIFGCSSGTCTSKLYQLYNEGKSTYIEGKVISGSETGMAPEKGLYKFYLANMESPDCDMYKQEWLIERPKIAPKNIPKGVCISGQKVESYAAPYKYERKQEFSFLDNLSRDRATFTILETGEIVCEAAKFRYFYGWFYRYLHKYKLTKGSHLTCSGYDAPKRRDFFSGIIYEALLPDKNR